MFFLFFLKIPILHFYVIIGHVAHAKRLTLCVRYTSCSKFLKISKIHNFKNQILKKSKISKKQIFKNLCKIYKLLSHYLNVKWLWTLVRISVPKNTERKIRRNPYTDTDRDTQFFWPAYPALKILFFQKFLKRFFFQFFPNL